MKKVLILGSSWVGIKYVPKALAMLGYEPMFMLDINEFPEELSKIIKSYEWYQVDIDSIDKINQAISNNSRISSDVLVGVTSLLDDKMKNASLVAERLEISGPDKSLKFLLDKAIVQKEIPEFSPPSIQIFPNEFSEKNIHELLKLFVNSQRIIVKPCISSGGLGNFFLREEQLPQILDFIQTSGVHNPYAHAWLVQPEIVGDLYSLEGYFKNRIPNFIGFSKRTRIQLTESSNQFPADHTLEKSLQQRCKEAILTLSKKSNFVNGYFHCEFIITKKDVYFIDANLGRIGGGSILEQVALTFNKSPEEIMKHVIDIGIFGGKYSKDKFYDVNVSMKSTLSINYGINEESEYVETILPENLISLHTSFATSGSKVSVVGKSDYCWIGTLAGYTDIVIKEIDKIKIKTKHGYMCPCYKIDCYPDKNLKLVVITGITKGLGRAMLDRFDELGWKVVGCARSKQEIESLRLKYSDKHDFQIVDVSKFKEVEDWSNYIIKNYGAPDLLINNASIVNKNAPIWKISAEEFNQVMDVNVNGIFNMMRNFLPFMIECKKGVVVNMSSGWGRSAEKCLAPYCSSKFAVEGLSQSVAQELPKGMAVVALDPGGSIDTPMLRQCAPEEVENSPSPDIWSKVAVPYIINIKAEDNGKSLTCPRPEIVVKKAKENSSTFTSLYKTFCNNKGLFATIVTTSAVAGFLYYNNKQKPKI